MPPRLAVLISGGGSNLQALMDAVAQGRLDAEIALVVSNRKAAHGLARAQAANLPTLYLPLKPWTDSGRARADYDADLAERLTAFRPDLVVLAGWMHVLGAAFLERFPGRVVNLHPALPGAFPGTDAIRRAFDAFRAGEIRESGCMLHYVVPEVDAGPVIAQFVVPILADDSLDTFEARMHAAEHALIVEAVGLALADRRPR
ncbi:MAG: phosphoribosylglycinamide formyltransferase [Anaerolineae bacterium]